MKNLPLKLKGFIIFLYIFTAISFYYFISHSYIKIEILDYKALIFFIFLMALTESFAIEFKNLTLSTGFAVTVASFQLYGPFVTLIVIVVGYSLRIIKNQDEYVHILNTPISLVLFNYCIYSLPVIYANYVFVEAKGMFGNIQFNHDLIPISLFCLTVFLVNVVLVGSFLKARQSEGSLLYYILTNFKLNALNFLAMSPLGLLAAYVFYPSNYIRLSFFIFPIILARFTFSLYIEAKSKYIQTVDVIMRAMEARDKYTEGHSKRVADISCLIAKELKYNEWKIENLNIAALLHDIGKIGIDDQILNKPDKLTVEEFNTIKRHPEIGFNILKEVKGIDDVKNIVHHHHERYDGKGYPDRKQCNELPLEVFIVQLADSIDAMATDRPYRKSMTEDEITAEVIKYKGTQFHPEVVDAYLRTIKR